jgi:hypothetical protein
MRRKSSIFLFFALPKDKADHITKKLGKSPSLRFILKIQQDGVFSAAAE